MHCNRDWGKVVARGVLTTLAVALAFLAVPGCGQKASGYNDTLADLHTKITATEKKMEELIEFSLHKDEAQGKLKAASEDFRSVVTEARTRFDSLTVPEGAQAKKLHEGFEKFLKAQEEIAPLYKELVDPGRKLTRDEDERVRENVRVVREKRDSIARRLPALQKAYAEEAGLKLKKQ